MPVLSILYPSCVMHSFIIGQGSQLELLVADDAQLGSFVGHWVTAASDAQGTAVRIMAQLEELESQQRLQELLQACSDGISQSRKRLVAMGQNPQLEAVRAELQTATCQRGNADLHASMVF